MITEVFKNFSFLRRSDLDMILCAVYCRGSSQNSSQRASAHTCTAEAVLQPQTLLVAPEILNLLNNGKVEIPPDMFHNKPYLQPARPFAKYFPLYSRIPKFKVVFIASCSAEYLDSQGSTSFTLSEQCTHVGVSTKFDALLQILPQSVSS